MYTFWQTVLLDERTFIMEVPFPPHAGLNIDNEHFEVWLTLWWNTGMSILANLRTPDYAENTDMFLEKTELLQNNFSQPLV